MEILTCVQESHLCAFVETNLKDAVAFTDNSSSDRMTRLVEQNASELGDSEAQR